jgi:hypothetical protein
MKSFLCIVFFLIYSTSSAQNTDTISIDIENSKIRVVSDNVIMLEYNRDEEVELYFPANARIYLRLKSNSGIGEVTYSVLAFKEYNLGVYPPEDPLITFDQRDEQSIIFKIDHGRMPSEKRRWFLWFLDLN